MHFCDARRGGFGRVSEQKEVICLCQFGFPLAERAGSSRNPRLLILGPVRAAFGRRVR